MTTFLAVLAFGRWPQCIGERILISKILTIFPHSDQLHLIMATA
jgi:hypothetical protein